MQQRLYQVVQELKNNDDLEWTASMPLAILNPYGTGSNGLYLYFETDFATSVSYTVHVDGLTDFTAEAADASGKEYTKTNEFQLIGLVPGEVNEVTLNVAGRLGNTRQTICFTVEMPETRSGYATQLEVTEGESSAAQAEGLFTMMRVNGYLGYGFFFDNEGVLRYEMVLEGYGLDRLLFYGDEILTCVSSSKLARINRLGQVTWVCDLGEYDLHHDIGWGGRRRGAGPGGRAGQRDGGGPAALHRPGDRRSDRAHQLQHPFAGLLRRHPPGGPHRRLLLAGGRVGLDPPEQPAVHARR